MDSGSFKDHKIIGSETIAARIETVKELQQQDLEQYEIVKDRDTGEHYLHYSYLHRNLSGSGEPEIYHQLLPLHSDDVLGIIFGEQAYKYPEYWKHSFMRNGPDGSYVWFDPSYEDEMLENEAIGRRLAERLEQFKQAGAFDEESVRKFLNELDQNKA